MLSNFEFQSPEFFWLFLLLPVVAVWYFFKRNKLTAQVKLSSLKGFKAGSGLLAKFRPVLFVLRLLALACLITSHLQSLLSSKETSILVKMFHP